MVRCSHRGCGKEFETLSLDDICIYHPGGPVFHEGLKSWSCCNTVNKPVLDFEEFTKITGCTRGTHTAETLKEESSRSLPSASESIKMTSSRDGKEVYGVPSIASTKKSNQTASAMPSDITPSQPVEEEDDLDAPAAPGTPCRHNGCKVVFVSDEQNRKGEGPGTSCTYHPANPIFHEGSKGYLCCKRRVLEFDEFLKIDGCKRGRHVFVPKATKGAEGVEELVECRIDHYQTPHTVQVSVFAKQADSTRSTLTLEDEQVHLDLYLPGAKRFRRSLNLFGQINISESSYKFFGTKVEITLRKADGKSWTLLEKTDQDLGNIALTFGVGGRTGTIGAKELAK